MTADLWQVVRFADGAVTVCCAHRYEQTADFCADWRNRQDPLTNGQYDVRRAITRSAEEAA